MNVTDFNWAGIPHADQLKKRIRYLLEALEEEICDGPEYQRPLRKESVENFLNYMRNNHDVGYPSVTVSYEGIFMVSLTMVPTSGI